MGIFSGLFRSRDKPQDSLNGSTYSFFLGGSTAGKHVNERTAMQMTAVYSCVRILSEAVAGLPLHLYRYNDSGGKEKATDNPLYYLLHDEPNPEMTSFIFRETLMTHLLLWGNAYAQIIRNGKGEVVGLYPLMPSKMTVDRDKNGVLYYKYRARRKTVLTSESRKRCICSRKTSSTYLDSVLTDWSVTHRLRWLRTLSVWQLPVRNTARSFSPTVPRRAVCLNTPAH